jgi:cell wall integrity and stress response component
VAGIAAGVVVGVVVIAALIGGGFFYLRRKRNREIEEEYRRNAAVNAFIGKPPGSSGGGSMTDSRMDPVMAHRRMSDGSIADNQDYSRRILRVSFSRPVSKLSLTHNSQVTNA